MEKKKHKDEAVLCPVGRFFSDLEDMFGEGSKFFEHMNKSRIEFLKAMRTMVDEKIESLERKGSDKKEKKKTKIKVE